MDKYSKSYGLYLAVLKEELVPAVGCTEPIAIALASAAPNFLDNTIKCGVIYSE